MLPDLPVDILVLIFPYLDARSFLSLTSTCKAFRELRLDATYWRHVTQTTFRVPNQALVEHDGARWQKLYRRMLTQSHVFTWGSNGNGRLGHRQQQEIQPLFGQRRIPGRPRLMHSINCSFPTEMDATRDLGIISDMQCGGWSTTLLTSKGSLYTAGVLDGQTMLHFSNNADGPGPQPLRFPASYHSAASASYHEPTTAIRQFSSGRQHILGLSDSGKIWTWYAKHQPALQLKFMHVDMRDTSSHTLSPGPSLYGRVKKVLAGWSRSSAYIYGTGIVVWDPVSREANEDEHVDTKLIVDTIEIPKTAYQRVKGASRESEDDAVLGRDVGVVLNYILLEHYVVFVTDIGRVFCAKFEEDNRVDHILELRALRNEGGTPSDVQGSFRSFALFKNGEVITTNQGYLDACWDAQTDNPEQTDIEGLKRIPALQQNNVISVAFGDYHFLALHSTGKITSYGTELQACGALGLGGDGEPEGRIRGIRYAGGEGKLLPHAYMHGRQVWFEPEKKKWITYMTSGAKNPDEAKERMQLAVTDRRAQGELSEWIEQEGRDWDKDPEVRTADDDGLGSYFALSVSAAGWHSSAIVLVNESLAARVRARCIIRDPDVPLEEESEEKQGDSSDGQRGHGLTLDSISSFLDPIAHGASPQKGYKYVWTDKSFPRLILRDGREMPGEVPFDEWRFGRPEWRLDVDM